MSSKSIRILYLIARLVNFLLSITPAEYFKDGDLERAEELARLMGE